MAHETTQETTARIEKRFVNVGRSKTFRNIVNGLKLNEKRVLDIGCSYGEFTAHFGKGSTGITIVKEESDYGTKRGLDIRYGNIEAKDFVLTETYDAIFANNLLEHLLSPHEFLLKIKQYLKPDGILILGVPCIPKVVSLMRLHQKFRGSLAVAHINFYTKDTLQKTAERAGWVPTMTRGFHFGSPLLDHLLDPVYPHFYVVAKVDENFAYHEKRLKELAGYGDT